MVQTNVEQVTNIALPDYGSALISLSMGAAIMTKNENDQVHAIASQIVNKLQDGNSVDISLTSQEALFCIESLSFIGRVSQERGEEFSAEQYRELTATLLEAV